MLLVSRNVKYMRMRVFAGVPREDGFKHHTLVRYFEHEHMFITIYRPRVLRDV